MLQMNKSTIRLLAIETKSVLRSPLFWLVHPIPIYNNWREMSRFLGKRGYVHSEFIAEGI